LGSLSQVFQSTKAGGFEVLVELGAEGFQLLVGRLFGDEGPVAPAYGDFGEGFGDLETIPGAGYPGFLRFEVEAADGGAGELGQFDWAELGLVDGTAGAVSGEDGWSAFVEDFAEAE
jgi:hypothetical protein